MIEVENLTFSYGRDKQALHDLNFTVGNGEIFGFLGPNGSGKSTFLRCLNLLEDVTEGEIYVDNELINTPKVNINVVRQKMGMVFQHFNLFPHKTILENMTLAPIKVKGMSQEAAREKALQLLDRVGLKDRADAYPIQLSGGQKQRLSIARVFLKNPPILIFDEATSALDNETEAALMEAINSFHGKKTMIIIAHRLNTIENCDIIYRVSEGKMEEVRRREG